MVAYNYMARFVPDVEALIKRQTIRANRKRHARPGEWMQNFTGMRSKKCRKIMPDPICESVTGIRFLVPPPGGVMQMMLADQTGAFPSDAFPGLGWTSVDDHFARADGFTDAQDMCRFWQDNHGVSEGGAWFEGVLIKWRPDP